MPTKKNGHFFRAELRSGKLLPFMLRNRSILV